MRRAKGREAIGFSAWCLAAFVACGSEDGDSVLSGAGAANSEREPIGSDGDSPIVAGNAERRTIRVARRGGQSGMEGSCQPVPDPQPFSADDVRALIEGTHATTLAYRAERRTAGSAFDDAVGLPMTVKVVLQGEPPIGDPDQGEGCNVTIPQDVEVTLSLDEPALDVVIETTASAFSSTFAVLQVELGSDVAAALGLPIPRDVITLSIAFTESGMKGTLEPHDECGRAVFPASVHCPDWPTIEVDLDRQRDGFRPRQALTAVEELGDIPLTWSDGSQTTLAVSLAEAPEWACSSVWVENVRPERLKIPVSVRAVTADGRLDAELPAELSVEVSTEACATEACGSARTAGKIGTLHLSASYFGVAAGGPGPGVIPPLEADTGFTLDVWTLSDRTTADILLQVLEQRDPGLTPPLDATTDVASASCVVFGALVGGG